MDTGHLSKPKEWLEAEKHAAGKLTTFLRLTKQDLFEEAESRRLRTSVIRSRDPANLRNSPKGCLWSKSLTPRAPRSGRTSAALECPQQPDSVFERHCTNVFGHGDITLSSVDQHLPVGLDVFRARVASA